jgi:outer membrane protein
MISEGNLLPDLSFNADQKFNLGNSFNVSTAVGQRESSSNTFYLSSSIVLFDGLSNINKIKLSKMNIENGQLKLNNIRKNLEISITNHYLQGVFHKEAIKIAKNRLENSVKQLSRIKGLYENESVTKSELLENESLVEADRNNVVEAKNNLKNTLIRIKEIISIEDIKDFDIMDIDVESFEENMLYEKEKIFNFESIDKHPSILVLKSNAEINGQQVKINKLTFYPKVSFDYSYGTGYYHILGQDDKVFNSQTNEYEDNGFIKQLDNNRVHYLGFSLTVPIFNKFATKGKHRKSKLDYEISEINLINGKKEILNKTKQAYNDVVTAESSLKSTKTILLFQEEAFKVSSEKYRLGVSSIYEFIESRNRLLTSQADYIKSKYDYLLKIKIFNFYFE